MNKILIFLVALVTVGIVYGVTLTADATESVTVPTAALATICLVDSSTGECTDKIGEILFGNAVVVSRATSDSIGLVLIQFGGQLYRATSFSTVYNNETTLVGLQGTLSQVLSDGNEVDTTGEVWVIEDELKGSREESVPVGTFYIEYEGLELEDSDECGPYSYLDESGEPVKGVSTRECVSQRGVMTAGEYTNLHFTINAPGGIIDKYKLVEITDTTSFEWTPE